MKKEKKRKAAPFRNEQREGEILSFINPSSRKNKRGCACAYEADSLAADKGKKKSRPALPGTRGGLFASLTGKNKTRREGGGGKIMANLACHTFSYWGKKERDTSSGLILLKEESISPYSLVGKTIRAQVGKREGPVCLSRIGGSGRRSPFLGI